MRSYLICALLIASTTLLCACQCTAKKKEAGDGSSLAVRLAEQSSTAIGPLQSYSKFSLTEKDFEALSSYVIDNQDVRAFQALMLLRKNSTQRYNAIHPRVRAKILCSALRHLEFMNDWGDLPKPGQKEAITDTMAALLESDRESALQYLLAELNDNYPAPFVGSAEATGAWVNHYRHSDFAARACCLILGRDYELKDSIVERDADIDLIKSSIKARTAVP